MNQKKKKLYKVLKILGKIFLGILIFLLLVILFVRSPWGQNIIKDKFISSLSRKTGTEVTLDKLYIKFNGDIQVDGLYIEDQQGDTLIYSESLSADIPLWPIIRGNGIGINEIDWKHVRANIIRKDSISGFNYEFLMNAYSSDTTGTSKATDTTGSPMNISLGDFNLENFKVNYRDEVSGIDSRINFDQLQLEFTESDVTNMVFRADDAVIKNAELNYTQTHPFPESDSEPPPLPLIAVNNLELHNVRGIYDSKPDSLYTNFDIVGLNLEKAEFDLKNNKLSSEFLSLSDSRIVLEMQQSDSKSSTKTQAQDTGFQWPDWKIDIAETNLSNDYFNYSVNGAEAEKGTFNPNAVKIDSLFFESNGLSYQDKKAQIDIQKLQFKEGSGINLHKFNLQALVSDEKIEISGLDLGLNNNSVAGNMTMEYSGMDEFIKNPGGARIRTNLNDIYLQISDFYRFQPDLKNNQYIQALAGAPVQGNFSAQGKVENINLESLNLSWRNTRISGSGSLVNLQDPENLSYNLPNLSARTQRSDLLRFVKEEDLGIRLPENIQIKGNFSGNTGDVKTDALVVTSEGTLDIKGNFQTGDKIVFDATVAGDSIALGRLLQNEDLGNIKINVKASGKGSSINNLNADLDSEISSFTYKDYEFRNIDIKGKLENGKGPVNLIYQDQNLEMEAQTNIRLDSVSPRYDFTIYLDGADLGALGITQRNIKTGFTLEGWYEGDVQNYEVDAKIIDGVAVYNNKTYLLGSFDAHAFVEPDTTSVTVDNRILDLNLQSNASPNAFAKAINNHFKRYIDENYKEDTIINPVNLQLDAKIREAPILTDVFFVNLKEVDTIDIKVDFAEKERTLNAAISVPHITYFSSEIDSLKLDLSSDTEDLNFNFAFNSLDAGPIAIKKTIIKGGVINRKLDLEFTSLHEEERIVHINSQLNFQGDTLKFHLEPKELILNKNPWEISDNNLISLGKEYINFQDFRLTRNDQVMEVLNNKPGVEKENLSVSFNNFKLAALLNYLNPENQLAKGNLNGDLTLEEPFGKTGIIANMEINQFEIMNVDLNTLSLAGNSSRLNNYDFEMKMYGGQVDFDLTGSYVAAETSAKLDMNLDLKEFKMAALEGFSQGEIRNGSGSFSGNINVGGTVADPEYKGQLNFNQAKFNVAYLNAAFVLPNEKLNVDNKGVYFDNFNINDLNGNSFIVNGDIQTEDLFNPVFDLDLQADNFKLLSSTKEDNKLFYGDAAVDLDAQITGNLNLPEVNATIEFNENTDFTYVVPESELQINERDGVVIFVNKENPDDILTQTEEVSYVVSGYDIFARIKVDQGAKFTMIINQETGDKFQVQGEGDLIFNMYPNGRTALTGIYEINDGFYEMSLYNLVKRRFDIANGSRVSWAGDPFDAQLDVRAIYKVETSAYSLMSSQLSGADQSVAGRYRQELPFWVYLNVDGELTEPKITFNLDMPEDAQGSVGGEVYGRIQQLNNQEQELNKQVFSLLVLNRFFPGSGSDGSQGGTLAVARDNLNQALSDQLNMLSSKIMGESGIKLNFQVDSYTDYQGENPQDRTQLDINAQKAFLEDRLVVQVGSEVDIQGGNQPGQESSPVIGNVSIAYLLDENGTWRLKGFRRNQYENVIDGQLIVSGIALIFTKEFNHFKNLFEKAVVEETKMRKKSEAKNPEEEENSKKEDEN